MKLLQTKAKSRSPIMDTVTASRTQEKQNHLPENDSESEGDLLLPTLKKARNRRRTEGNHRRWLWKAFVLVAGLWITLSTAINFVLCVRLMRVESHNGLSPYLNLEYRQSDTMWWNTEFSNTSASEAQLDELWDTAIPWESGIIALTNEEAESMGLPDSQPWPWDGDAKKIYIVNAHHLLHCVRNIYISIQQYRRNQAQTISHAHILHCLDSLRADTVCSADDTPRYVPLNSDDRGFRPGDGQPRTCRDWSKVEDFVASHDPCYRYLEPGNEELNNLERFKFCPPDSEYLPVIRGYFGYEDDWVPAPQEGPRELDW